MDWQSKILRLFTTTPNYANLQKDFPELPLLRTIEQGTCAELGIDIPVLLESERKRFVQYLLEQMAESTARNAYHNRQHIENALRAFSETLDFLRQSFPESTPSESELEDGEIALCLHDFDHCGSIGNGGDFENNIVRTVPAADALIADRFPPIKRLRVAGCIYATTAFDQKRMPATPLESLVELSDLGANLIGEDETAIRSAINLQRESLFKQSSFGDFLDGESDFVRISFRSRLLAACRFLPEIEDFWQPKIEARMQLIRNLTDTASEQRKTLEAEFLKAIKNG